MRATRRLISIAGLAAAGLTAAAAPLSAQWASDPWLDQPVDDATFESWRPFFSYDTGVPFDLQTLSVANEEGIRIEHISFTSTPGEVVYADYYTVPAAGRGRPHVVLVHGGRQSGKTSVRPMAEVLVRRGFGVIAIDMPYFGERDTGLLRSFDEADKHEHLYNRESTYLEWLVQLVKDVGRTIDLLREHYGVNVVAVARRGGERSPGPPPTDEPWRAGSRARAR